MHELYCQLINVFYGYKGGLISVVLAVPATATVEVPAVKWEDFIVIWLIRLLAIAASLFSIHASYVVAKARKLQIKKLKEDME